MQADLLLGSWADTHPQGRSDVDGAALFEAACMLVRTAVVASHVVPSGRPRQPRSHPPMV